MSCEVSQRLRIVLAPLEELTGGSDATKDFLVAQLGDVQGPQLKLDILAHYYRALDGSRPIARHLVFAGYLIGFVLITIPAATTFVQIVRSLFSASQS